MFTFAGNLVLLVIFPQRLPGECWVVICNICWFCVRNYTFLP